MNRDQRNDLPAELAAIEDRLRSERPAASGVELDELKLRSMRQVRQANTRPGGQLLKSRLALLTMIVAGLMMSMTGATLAITGSSSGEGTAAQQEYGSDTIAPQSQEGTGGNGTVGGDVAPSQESGGEAPAATPETQETRQAAASSGSDGSLPFTGLLAIPLLIGGVALLGTGAVLRRRAED